MKFVCMFAALVNDALATEHHHAKTEEVAGGHEKKGEKIVEYKHIKKSGKSKKHDEEKIHKGEVLKDAHKKVTADGGGKKSKYHTKDGHKSSNDHSGASEHGAKFEEDEHKKHNSFYSNAHKSGEFEVYGQKHAKFNSRLSSKKKVENHKAAKDRNDYKKSLVKVGGHDAEDQKGHKDEKATKSHHSHHEKWAKKGSKKGGKQYKYKVPPHK
ncbi:hypothetical protein BDFB_011061 [Asbolus verrucosus]|uniref:Uncharacterized protein n=1 Tax=Asbolus verrucosus TaxID=1661398 RepID=A0A482W189_ASBVE|nr:hypothetical protein BDFB_011061 [Asbolus verrucosus]